MTVRRLYHKVRGPFKRMVKMRSIKYRGFLVELYNNKVYGFRYEWKVHTLNPVYFRLTKYRGKIRHVLHDPTSTRTPAVALDYGKGQVNELRSPFWFNK